MLDSQAWVSMPTPRPPPHLYWAWAASGMTRHCWSPVGSVTSALPGEPKALCAEAGADTLTRLAGTEGCLAPCPTAEPAGCLSRPGKGLEKPPQGSKCLRSAADSSTPRTMSGQRPVRCEVRWAPTQDHARWPQHLHPPIWGVGVSSPSLQPAPGLWPRTQPQSRPLASVDLSCLSQEEGDSSSQLPPGQQGPDKSQRRDMGAQSVSPSRHSAPSSGATSLVFPTRCHQKQGPAAVSVPWGRPLPWGTEQSSWRRTCGKSTQT